MSFEQVFGWLFALFATTFVLQLAVRWLWARTHARIRPVARPGATVRVRRRSPLPTGLPLHAHRPSAPTGPVEIDSQLVDEVRRQLDDIPPIPVVVQRLLQEMASPRSNARTVSEIARTDPVLAATFLRVVNSAFYGLSRPVTDLDRAIALLGYRTIHSLVVQYGFARLFPAGGSRHVYRTEDLWVHSLAVSLAGQTLCRGLSDVDAGFVSTLGLLHDIGKLVIATRFPERIEDLWTQRAAAGATYLQRERDLFGADHTELGAHLVRQWKLPEDLAIAVRLHHSPGHPDLARLERPRRRALAVVHVANQLTKFCHAYCEDVEVDLIGDEFLIDLGLGYPLENLLAGPVRESITRAIHIVDQLSPQPLVAVGRLIGVRTARELSGLKAIPSAWMNDPVLARIRVGSSPVQSFLDGVPSVEIDLDVDGPRKAIRFPGGQRDATLRFPTDLPHLKEAVRALGRCLDAMDFEGPERFQIRFLVKYLLGNILHAETSGPGEIRIRRGLEQDILTVASEGLAFDRLIPIERLRAERGPELAGRVCQALVGAALGRILTLGWFDAIEVDEEGVRIAFVRTP